MPANIQLQFTIISLKGMFNFYKSDRFNLYESIIQTRQMGYKFQKRELQIHVGVTLWWSLAAASAQHDVSQSRPLDPKTTSAAPGKWEAQSYSHRTFTGAAWPILAKLVGSQTQGDSRLTHLSVSALRCPGLQCRVWVFLSHGPAQLFWFCCPKRTIARQMRHFRALL